MPENGKRGRPRKTGKPPGAAAGRGAAKKKPKAKPGQPVDKARRRAASGDDDENEETDKARRSRPPQQDEEEEEDETEKAEDDEEEDDEEEDETEKAEDDEEDEEDEEDDDEDVEADKADDDDDDDEDVEADKADDDDDDDDEDVEADKADDDDDDEDEDDEEDESAGPPPPRGGKPANKAGVTKAGRRMAKDRLNRFQKALELLSDVLKELTAAGKEPAAGGAPDPKARKRAGTPGLGELVASVGELTNVVKRQQEELVSLRKTRATSNAIAVEGGRRRESQDVSWPLDMNRPISRDTVGKSVSFFDET
jgi:hypothetical protein